MYFEKPKYLFYSQDFQSNDRSFYTILVFNHDVPPSKISMFTEKQRLVEYLSGKKVHGGSLPNRIFSKDMNSDKLL